MFLLRNKQKSLFFVLISFSLFCYSNVSAQDSRTAQGKNGMVATAHPLASEAALKILKMGGNAIDAAVAAAFTIGVVEPDASGLGGGGGMVVYLKKENKSFYINFYQQASSRINEINFNRETDRHSVKSILIPGTTEGLTTALRKFGTLPLLTVMESAIYYAEHGFEVDETLAKIILDNVEMLQIDSVTSRIYLDEDFPRMEGDTLKQPELTKTLRTIARLGRNGFYTGPVAEEIVSRINAGGGAVTIDDFKNYRAHISKPLIGSYRGYTILGTDAPQSGATIIQALNMLENVNLKESGHYSTSPATLHIMAETFKRAYADRWSFIGDERFGYVPLNGLISKDYARERYLDINQFKAVPKKYQKTQAGNPGKYDTQKSIKSNSTGKQVEKHFKRSDENQEGTSSHNTWSDNMFVSFGGRKETAGSLKKYKATSKNTINIESDSFSNEEEFDGHTTHLSIIDKEGNAVSLTQTLGTFFGSGQTFAGVLLNCGITNFSQSSPINMVKPGMQPRSSIAPTIVLKEQNPFMVVGSPGAGRIIATVVELIVNAVDFGMDVTQTNDAPRFYCQKWDNHLHIESGISQEVQDKVAGMGHNVRYYGSLDLFFGGAQLIYIDPETGVYYGSADKRRGGAAIGY